MATYTALALSGSTNGRPIPVAATATPGTLVHTTSSTANVLDEVYLNVSNVTAAAATLTVEWGGVTSPGDHLVKDYSIPANSAPTPIGLGARLTGGVVVRAFSGTANALNIAGWVNRITP